MRVVGHGMRLLVGVRPGPRHGVRAPAGAASPFRGRGAQIEDLALHSELGATAIPAGVAIVFAIGEGLPAVIIGPLVANSLTSTSSVAT
jgi:hypothetical protein